MTGQALADDGDAKRKAVVAAAAFLAVAFLAVSWFSSRDCYVECTTGTPAGVWSSGWRWAILSLVFLVPLAGSVGATVYGLLLNRHRRARDLADRVTT